MYIITARKIVTKFHNYSYEIVMSSDVNRLNFNRLLIAINRSNRLINRLRILND